VSEPRRVYLLRHGETEGESSVRFHGSNDVPLSEVGRAQVRAQARRLAGLRFAALVHSPLARAAESARIVLEELRARPAAVEVERDFREVHFGLIEGLSEPEIEVLLPDWHREWKAGRIDGFPEGETLAAFAARVARALDVALARHARGDLLIVAHKGIVKRALAHLAGLEAEAMHALPVDLGSVAVVAWNGGWVVEEVNVGPG
jgi:broad specificity phosphatase PhoE